MIFWSDPHLGLNRTSHTTAASRKLLQEALLAKAKQVTVTPSICLGDLFDTTDNEERVIVQGAEIAKKVAAVLSGNHDLPNRDGKLSSLQLIGELVESTAVVLLDKDTNFVCLPLRGFNELILVPHKRTQALFDETLNNLLGLRKSASSDKNVVCLHCNYNSPFATDEASLNLSRDQAQALLSVFDYILIGHEHIPRSDFEGRVQLLGNIHPTSFADISDKFIWEVTTEGLSPIKVWDKATHYLSLDWEALLSLPTLADELQFIEVIGTAPAARLPDIARAIQKLWGVLPNALMIKNAVKSDGVAIVTETEVQRALDVPARITQSLQNTPLLPLWLSYLGQL